jgi:signal transduction histidine kinase
MPTRGAMVATPPAPQPAAPRFDLTVARRDGSRAAALEAELRRATERLHRLEAERRETEQLLAMAAHEIVAPLLMTEAYAGLVTDALGAAAPPQARDDLATMARASARARRLGQGLLLQARGRRCPPRREPVDLNRLAADVVAMLRPEIAERGADVRIGRLPVVTGDPDELAAVLTNLVANALKHSGSGAPAVRVGARWGGGAWEIRVDSDGPELAAGEAERVFEPLERGSAASGPGAGLGLAICRRLMARQGGTVGVRPRPEGGNRFFLTLSG